MTVSSVQRPESSVQSAASRAQSPTLASRVQEFPYAVIKGEMYERK